MDGVLQYILKCRVISTDRCGSHGCKFTIVQPIYGYPIPKPTRFSPSPDILHICPINPCDHPHGIHVSPKKSHLWDIPTTNHRCWSWKGSNDSRKFFPPSCWGQPLSWHVCHGPSSLKKNITMKKSMYIIDNSDYKHVIMDIIWIIVHVLYP